MAVWNVGDAERGRREELIEQFNETASAYPKDKSIVDLFEEQAINSPDATAVIFEGQKISYKALNERSNQLARYLKKQGVKAETLVLVCVERSAEMLIGILGILKAGGTYVPVDPDYPQDRITYMLQDTGAKLILSSRKSRSKISESATVKVIELDGDWKQIAKEQNSNPETSIRPNQLAYVIYTSGSTGRPKGVMIEHQNANAFIAWCKDEFADSKFDIVYATTSICFDLSIFELFYPLSIGKPVRILENGLAIPNYLTEDTSVLINTVPSVVESLLNEKTDLSRVSVINMAGEPIPARVSERLDTLNTEVRNLYGPTEDTTYSTRYRLQQGKPVLIGTPISNTGIYILNNDKELSPIGVSGEICIGGAGTARGYLNQPELTAEKFIKDPFSTNPKARLYRTGDLGRWLADGNIEYHGRIDEQVKIRGYRIELGEIESVLNQNETISQGVVLAKEDKQGTKRLVGYVVTSQTAFDKQAIQAWLNEKLPEYMVPAIWVELDSIPLTPNGKVDKKALPDPELTDLSAAYVAPGNETEQALADIWQELLHIEQIGINNNFFELGGHSLLAMRVVSAVRKELDVEISIRDLFVHPTIAGLGAYLDEQHKGTLLPAIIKTERPAHIPLSFSQERLWFIDQLEGTVQYHIPAVLRLKGELNQEALQNTLQAIISRHEVLRTVIGEHNGQGYQQIIPATGWSLTVEDKTDDTVIEPYIAQLISKPFDLSADYMLRAELIETGQEEHVLVVTTHHIASDGWSTSILVKEVMELYTAHTSGHTAQLPDLPIQYADYAIWQREYLQGEVLEAKLDYWKTKLANTAPLQLPADHSRPAVQSSKGAAYSFKIDAGLSAQLQTLSQGHGATLYMTLLAAFNVLLYRYSGQEDICVGTPIAGRSQQELEGLIGFFINTLALRSKLSAEMTFSKLLSEVKDTTLEAYGHQEVPFEKIVDAVVKTRDMSRSPLFQVLFSLQNTPDVPKLELGELQLFTAAQEHTTAKFDIAFLLNENSSGIQGTVEYNTALYEEATIARMAGHYIHLLRSVVAGAEEQIGNLEILAEQERKELEQFNETTTEYPKDKSITALFEQQAAKIREKELSYKELNERANQLARYLIKQG